MPPIFTPLCRACHLSESQARWFWSALWRSRAPGPTQWRRQLLLLHDTHVGTVACPPQTVVEVLEALIEEGTLRADVGRAIEENVLCHTDATGAWHGAAGSPYASMAGGHHAAAPECGSDLAATIEQYWR